MCLRTRGSLSVPPWFPVSWKQEAALPFPVGCIKGEPEKARASWGASALPWLILTDKTHKVAAEGFGLEELDAKLGATSK